MWVPLGAISIASMLSGEVCDRPFKTTWSFEICCPVRPDTVIVDGYGDAGPVEPLTPGMTIGVELLKSVGTVRSSSWNSFRAGSWTHEPRREAPRSAGFLFLFRISVEPFRRSRVWAV